jgi:hypothetical protein
VEEKYTDEELQPWFDALAAGYPFDEAGERQGMDRQKLRHTYFSDWQVGKHALNLSMIAGHKIRHGMIPVPDRADGLYEAYRDPAKWKVDNK